jgi:hypothetical protein
MLISRHLILSRLKMLDLLARLAVESGSAKSFYFSPVSGLEGIEKLRQVLVSESVSPDMVETISSSITGAILFWGVQRKLLILPPFPINDNYIALGYDIEPLHSVLQSAFKIALVLVRMGAFAIGVSKDEELIVSKVGTGLVHARHKKGGSSQMRFQRRRENEVAKFIKRVCVHVETQLESQAGKIDYLAYGGGREAIHLLHNECHFLHQFDDRVLPPMLDVPTPRRTVLEKAMSRVWSSKVIEWHET